ncbi:MAG: RidA family protein [Actinobacteria bacterium]|nr:RidA family protein [Actinomycetota bacterium]
MTNPTGLPYTPSLRVGDWVIVSGQIGMVDGGLVRGGFEDELRVALSNVASRLAEHGASMAQVVKTTVFLHHMTDYGEMNRLYAEAFPDEPRPARSAVAVGELPLGAMVEIEAWAYLDER